MTEFACEAAQFGAVKVCGRCNLSWPALSAGPAVCKPDPDPPIRLGELKAVADELARGIEARQRAVVKLREQLVAEGRADELVAQACAGAPHMDELRKAAVLRGVCRIVDRIQGDQVIIDRLKNRGGG